ncbi:hypothetical protein Dimus_035025 [Dionaea muscipula]
MTANMVKEGSLYFLLVLDFSTKQGPLFLGRRLELHADVLRVLFVGCKAHGDIEAN